jgi:hypothetical protein
MYTRLLSDVETGKKHKTKSKYEKKLKAAKIKLQAGEINNIQFLKMMIE